MAESPNRAQQVAAASVIGAVASPASDASCLATSTGCRPGSTEIPLPALSRVVLDSANAIPVNGSTAGV